MNVGAISSVGAKNTNLLVQDALKNSVSFSGKSESMSDEDKKELILKARTKASGYAFWGGTFSLLYYALRSDEKVARKYNLDAKEDKDLITKIKKEQVKWTIPSALTDIIDAGAIMGFFNQKTRLISLAVGAGAYLYNKCFADKKDIEL